MILAFNRGTIKYIGEPESDVTEQLGLCFMSVLLFWSVVYTIEIC